MKAFVTGCSGFIGGHILDNLCARGFDVSCLVRSREKASEIKRRKIKSVFGNLYPVEGSLSDANILSKALVGVDVVVNAAGVLGGWGVDDEILEKTHVDGVRNLLNAAVENNVHRFIQISSAGVLGPTENPPADENTPYNPSNKYEETKMKGEQIILERMGEIDATILRPEFVYGPRDTHVLGLFKAIKKNWFPLFNDGKSLLHPTYIQDVISAVNLVIDKENSKGETYLIAGEKPVQVTELVDVISRTLGSSPHKINVPLAIANTGATIMEAFGKIFSIEPPLTKSRILFFTKNRAFKTIKAEKQLGYKPVKLADGIKETVEWYKTNGFL